MSIVERHPFHPSIILTPYWPQEAPMDTSGIPMEGEWMLAMGRGGDLSLWRGSDPRPPELFPAYRHHSRETLERGLVMFCRRGYETDPRFVHTDGTVYLFNWRSFSLYQIGVAKRVFHLFALGRVDDAWTVGRQFGDQVAAAINHALGIEGGTPLH